MKSLYSGLTELAGSASNLSQLLYVANHLPKDFHRLKLNSVDSIKELQVRRGHHVQVLSLVPQEAYIANTKICEILLAIKSKTL